MTSEKPENGVKPPPPKADDGYLGSYYYGPWHMPHSNWHPSWPFGQSHSQQPPTGPPSQGQTENKNDGTLGPYYYGPWHVPHSNWHPSVPHPHWPGWLHWPKTHWPTHNEYADWWESHPGAGTTRAKEAARGVASDMASGPTPYWMMPHWALNYPKKDFGFERQLTEVKDEKDKFSIKLDVSQYSPDNIEIKARKNEVVIKGTHEEKKDDEEGYVSRSFSRRYLLPRGTLTDKISSTLRDGTLHVEAPKQELPDIKGEIDIPIEDILNASYE